MEKPVLINVQNQYYAIAAANLIMFCHGLVTGWASPALALLVADDSPLLSGPLSNEELSWIGSINCIGGLLGSFVLGFLVSAMGSKRSLLSMAIPSITFWLMIYFGNIYYHVLIARFISGWAGSGIQTAQFIYMSEIANDNIRGRLGNVWLFFRNIGILFGYIFGAAVDYQYIPLISGGIPIIFLIWFTMLPNTPQFHLRNGNLENAEKALKYYKGYQGNTELEESAIAKEFERLKSTTSDKKTEEKLTTADLLERSALKGLGIGIALTSFAQLTANYTMICYAVMIYTKAGTTIDPYVSSIITGIALILGSLLTTILADKLGRKLLNFITLIGSAVGLFSMGLYYYLHINGVNLTGFAWVPLVSLSFVIFVSSIGIVPLCYLCTIEYLPQKVRTFGVALTGIASNVFAFVSLKMFPILLQIVDLHGCMMIYGIGCVVGAIFVQLVLKETTGQSLDTVGDDEATKINRLDAKRLKSLC